MESRTGIVHNLYELLDKCKPAQGHSVFGDSFYSPLCERGARGDFPKAAALKSPHPSFTKEG
jgi:hypothetical protein